MKDYPSEEELAQLRAYGALEAANLELGTDEELLGKRVKVLVSDDGELIETWCPGTVVGFNNHQMWKRSSEIEVRLDMNNEVFFGGRSFVKLLETKINPEDLN